MNLSQPFRELDIERCVESEYFPHKCKFSCREVLKFFSRGVSHWGHVSSLEKGKIYAGGTIGSFQALTGWKVHFSNNCIKFKG